MKLYDAGYLRLRASDELPRAQLGGTALSLIRLTAPSQVVASAVAGYLAEHPAGTSASAYLGDGQFALMLCETPVDDAARHLLRLLMLFPEVTGAAVAYPGDGANFDDLMEVAEGRIKST